jgi:hypothetical protein
MEADAKRRRGSSPSRYLLEDHNQKRLFPTTIGGGATTVELAHQEVERRRQSKSLKFAGLASDWADRSCLVGI